MNKIIIACPAGTATGGPELLHQLCYKLRLIGYDAVMYYYEFNEGLKSPINERYLHYNNPYILEYVDDVNNVFVVSETKPELFKKAPLAKKVFWWLSVNFYTDRIKGRVRGYIVKCMSQFIGENNALNFMTNIRIKLNSSFDVRSEEVKHLVQSYYALDYCGKIGIRPDNIYYLSDYLSDAFIKNSRCNVQQDERKDIVLYNPKKGYQFTKKIIGKATNVQFVPLINLTPIEMAKLMKQAKVYIDFGEHPGKDRIPREAAISGCCVITGMQGAAAYQKDVSISTEFKFKDDDRNINKIIDKIHEIFGNYEEHYRKFHSYCQLILNEEKKFDEDLKVVFSKLLS